MIPFYLNDLKVLLRIQMNTPVYIQQLQGIRYKVPSRMSKKLVIQDKIKSLSD